MAELARPSRVMRKRIRDADSDSEAHTTQAETAQNGDQSSGIEQPSVSDILKQRKQAQKRKHGLAFSSSSQARRDMPSEDNSTQTTAAPKPVDSVYSRFTAQTGIIADAYDKQLEEYIDSQMRAPQPQGPETEPTQQPITTAQHQSRTPPQPSTAKPTDRDRHITLQEVDLPTAPPTAGAPPRGRDTQPPARRRRTRRTSADAQRDAAVDAILAESAGGTAYVGETGGGDAEADGGEGWGEGAQADERIAAAFRAAYLDEVERERAARRPPAAAAAGKAKGRAEDVLRGPRLGGSRSARARFVELQQAKK